MSTPTRSFRRASCRSRAPAASRSICSTICVSRTTAPRGPDFILNRPDYRQARILVGEDNFGCGSSRENAVWAVCDYGFRAVVAPSFGDIFYSNSLKNGLLPVVMPRDVVSALIASLLVKPDRTIEVDLASQRLTDCEGRSHAFDIDPFSKHCLLEGIDELDYTLAQMDRIDAFARRRAEEEGWAVPEGAGCR